MTFDFGVNFFSQESELCAEKLQPMASESKALNTRKCF